MLEFILNNVDFLLTLICAVIVCIFLARNGQIKKIKEIILSFCVNAEIAYGGGTGPIKKSSVLKAVYEMLPGWAKLFISDTTISKIIEDGKLDMDDLAKGNTAVMGLLYGTVTGDAESGEPAAEPESAEDE